MAEITRRRSGEILRKVFEILHDRPEGIHVGEILRRFEDEFELSEFESAEYPNRPGIRRFQKIVRFTTINAVKAGWLVKDKGTWRLTSEGMSAYESFRDPEAFMQEAVRLYKQWAQARPADEVDLPDTETESSTAILEEAEEAAWAEINDYLAGMPPYQFQDLIGALLEGMGYHVAYVAPPGPDRGVDLVAYTDPLGASQPRIMVQVKRRQDRIPVDGVRAFLAVLGDQDVGIFISLGGFTSEAQSEARHQERRRISLFDAAQLFDLWVEHYSRIPEASRQLLPLRPVHFLAPQS